LRLLVCVDMRLLKTTCAALAASLVVGVVARAEPQTTAQKPQFEVASVKPNKSGSRGGGGLRQGDRFVATNVTLRMLLQFAYRPQDGSPMLNDRLIGGPACASNHAGPPTRLSIG
jgi:hypothetical protein